DPHRITTLAPEELGLCLFRRPRWPCGAAAIIGRAARAERDQLAVPGARRLPESRRLVAAGNQLDYFVAPAPLRGGSITVPGDKSISHRALMLGAIAKGESVVSGFLPGEDCKATLAAVRSMGVAVQELDEATLKV